jgi:hypothetical protein
MFYGPAPFEESTDDEWYRLFDLNFSYGHACLCRQYEGRFSGKT